MSPIRHDETLMRLIRDVNEIKSALRRTVANLPLYDIANENTPAAISTDQNNYVPGNYDILRLNATANITITGFAGGVKGRFLEILNVGTGRITYVDGSTSSLPANRLNLPYDDNVTQLPNARARFYYDSTQQRWTLSDAPNIQGVFGKFALLTHVSGDNTIDTVATNTETLIGPNTIISDEWNYWDSANKRFTIPSGENGMYIIAFSGLWQNSASGGTLRQIRIMRNGSVNVGSIGVPSISGIATNMYVCIVTSLTAGQYVEFQVRQDSGGDLEFKTHSTTSPCAFFGKVA